jgi:hypothetical protein
VSGSITDPDVAEALAAERLRELERMRHIPLRRLLVVGDALRETAEALGQGDQQGLGDSRSVEQATPEQVSGDAQNPEGTVLRPDRGDPGAAIEQRQLPDDLPGAKHGDLALGFLPGNASRTEDD